MTTANGKRIFFAIGAALAALPSAALADPVVAYFNDEPATVSSKIANMCIGRGIMVEQQDAFHVQCAKEMSGMSGILAQAVMGNAYSTTPRQIVRFSISNVDGRTVIQAMQWVETQMAFGQVRREELNSKKQRKGLLDALLSLGGSANPSPVAAEADPKK